MEVIKKAIKVKPEEYFNKHLEIINPLMPTKFTPMEMKVLTAFMNIDGEEVEEGRFNPYTRKLVMKDLGLSAGGLGNYLRSLVKKGFLIKSKYTKNLSVADYLIPEDKWQGYQFKIDKDEVK